MILEVYRYIKPGWYFNLKPEGFNAYFPDPDSVSLKGNQLVEDPAYSTKDAMAIDLSYQLFNAGFLFKHAENAKALDVWTMNCFSKTDCYRFCRRHFHPFWSYYFLLIRIFTLKNPFTEIAAWIKTRGIIRCKLEKPFFPEQALSTFESELLSSKPMISVVIPTLNRYTYLRDVLKDLEQQDYDNFEVIVVDQSEPFDASFYEGWSLDLSYWHQEEKALWKARNDAIRHSKGTYILLYDDDSRVEPDWISEHIKALDFYNADISSGVSISTVGGSVPDNYSYYRWSDQLDTGNVLLKKEVFRKLGLFDRQFEKQRSGDQEFGLRSYLSGFRNVSNPRCKRVHLKVGVGGLRQQGSWDQFRPKKLLGPRPIPSVSYLLLKYFGWKTLLLTMVQGVPMSFIPYRFKSSRKALIIFIILLPLLLPLIVLSCMLSISEARQKLKTGAMISTIQ